LKCLFYYLKVFSAVVRAWSKNYEGHNHERLLDNLNRMERVADYSNSVAIVQSSGSGKSRMVYEQAALVFTLSFNLRPAKETQGSSP